MKKKFPGQREYEEVQLVVQKHWISDLKVVAVFIFLTFIPVAFYLGIAIKFLPEHVANHQLLALFFFSVYLLCTLLFTYVLWLDHELDVLIVTNERIINHDQVGFFHREVSETHLDQVQDIKGSERGVLQTIFHFGIMEIRTAADLVVFRIHDAADPFENARKILDIRDKFIHKLG